MNGETMLTSVSILKAVHVVAVTISISFFIVRLCWAFRRSPYLKRRWVRVTPHLVDTILLVSAIGMLIALQLSPFSEPWIRAKIVALCVYILSGSIALKRAPNEGARILAAAVALLSVTYILAVAISHKPVPFT